MPLCNRCSSFVVRLRLCLADALTVMAGILKLGECSSLSGERSALSEGILEGKKTLEINVIN